MEIYAYTKIPSILRNSGGKLGQLARIPIEYAFKMMEI